MKAVLLTKHGGPEVLVYGEAAEPVCRPGEVVVDVRAASVNAADYKVRLGGGREIEFPHILGRDFSGVVSRVGVTDFGVGDRVFGVLDRGDEGAYAEKLAVNAELIVRKPDNLGHTEAAAMALTGLTALWAIEDTARLTEGETILIHGGAGGVAGFAILLAKYIGATVITTASAVNHDYVYALGADQVIDYQADDFTKAAPSCDVVFDTVGGEVYLRSYEVLKNGGCLVSIASSATDLPPTGSPYTGGKGTDLAAKDAAGKPSTPNRRDVETLRPEVKRGRKHLERIIELIEIGAVRPPEISRYRLADAARAHRVSESRHLRGKLVLEVGNG